MEEEFVKRPRRHRPWKVFAAVVVLSVVCVAVWAALFGVNRFSVDLVLEGDREITLEHGAVYHENGAHAILRGTHLFKNGLRRNIPVEIHGNVDTGHTGKNHISYSASFLNLSASADRIVRIVDTQSPTIILTADPDADGILPGEEYIEAGFRAVDDYDGDITDRVIRYEENGFVYYSVTDSSGNPAYAQREIVYRADVSPQITLTEGEEMVVSVGAFFDDPGFTAADFDGNDLTDMVEVEGEVDWFTPGEYALTYTVSDEDGNTASMVRRVTIQSGPVQETVYPEGKIIYLTFDDGPCPDTERLLRILDKYNVKATFFVVNTGCMDVLQKIVDGGHSVGIHSMSHNYNSIYATPSAFFEDLYGMQEIIYRKTGITTYLMRFPGGSSNTISCFNPGIMTLLSGAVENAGFRYFDWNVDSNDAGGATSAQKVFENVTAGLGHQRISVVLQHDIHSYSVDAVEKIITWGLKNGYTFLPLQMDSPMAHHGINN